MAKTHFTGDLHIGHKKIIEYCKRPYSTVEEMDEQLVLNWNAVVAKEDYVHIVGDVAYCCKPDYAYDVLTRLNGWKFVIPGNHDEVTRKVGNRFPSVFASIAGNQIQEIEVEGQRIVLCHYAMREWHWALRGTWHLFGHTHNQLGPFGKSCDVGVDAWNFFPVSFEKLKDVMALLPIGPHARFEEFNAEAEAETQAA